MSENMTMQEALELVLMHVEKACVSPGYSVYEQVAIDSLAQAAAILRNGTVPVAGVEPCVSGIPDNFTTDSVRKFSRHYELRIVQVESWPAFKKSE